ncbi:hypothetical protein [uncultured Tateyamaria sp.]|uniref:hypothetical protein n=1 Tax=uncultured Tateyamaria sp. TaxID=455651 RepID=UPI002602F931|nr:hypothetical protein [uncultured Tateyamaria sp.]
MTDTLTQLAHLREIRRRRSERALADAQRAHNDAKRAHDISSNLLTIRRASKAAAERETYGKLVETGADGQALTALLTNLDAQADALAEADRKHLERWDRVERADRTRAKQARALAREHSKDDAWDDLMTQVRQSAEHRQGIRTEDEQDDLCTSRRGSSDGGAGQ